MRSDAGQEDVAVLTEEDVTALVVEDVEGEQRESDRHDAREVAALRAKNRQTGAGQADACPGQGFQPLHQHRMVAK